MPATPTTRDVFVSKFNRGLAIALWLIVALLFVTTVLNDATWQDRALALVPTAFGVLLGWVALWRPRLSVDDDGMEVVNVFHTVRVPWAALVHVDTRFALTLITPNRRVSVWAAPAPGRAGVALARRENQRHGRVVPEAEDGNRRAGDLLSTASGDAAYLIRQRWHELRERDAIELGTADSVRVPVTLHWLSIVLLAATAVGGWFAIAAR
ncbi:PH domain-containing protein [Curtobacterium sp. MCPF17_002]|uniref:PH domain-containing protein n=1 Tax=Curtobacterium sp. MCPF17_002 TaxID=2175645 RepID=UPI000DA90A58|nr:PH domain-containing protein [Curtobacterium sp. MCPF17_002]WIB78391.1 PH domain-containing protein [Curtobacterium sp. MCPF17_002]